MIKIDLFQNETSQIRESEKKKNNWKNAWKNYRIMTNNKIFVVLFFFTANSFLFDIFLFSCF